MQPIFIGIILSDGLSGLQQVLDLRLIQVWIALIDYIIEKLAALPYAHLHTVHLAVLFSHLLHLQNIPPFSFSNSRLENRTVLQRGEVEGEGEGSKRRRSENSRIKIIKNCLRSRKFDLCGSVCRNSPPLVAFRFPRHSPCFRKLGLKM